MPNAVTPQLLDAVKDTAAGRSHVPTSDAAKLLSKSTKTLRKLHSLNGHAYGVRPTKIGNDLMWPVAGIDAVLRGAADLQAA